MAEWKPRRLSADEMTTQTEAQRLAERLDLKDYYEFDASLHCPEAAAELRRLEAENTRLQASLEECSGNCTALKDQVRRMRSELERPMSSEATLLVHDNARLRKELEALRGAVPAGWKLVPIEPTEEMLDAADEADREYTRRNFGDVMTVMQGPYDHWCAMVAAAPQPAQGGK
jgi:predicted nuclease with TOPRIM domain